VNTMVSFCLKQVVHPSRLGQLRFNRLLLMALTLVVSFVFVDKAFANQTLPPLTAPAQQNSTPALQTPAHASADYRLTQQQGADLSRIELTLFKASYPQEPVFSRLNRIESTLYGETQEASSPAERLAKLKTFFEMRPDDLNPQAKAPLSPILNLPSTESGTALSKARPTSKTRTNSNKNRSRTKRLTPQPMLDVPKEIAVPPQNSQPNPLQNSINPEPSGDQTVDYPHINAMEQQAFGQVYSNLPLSQRIERLEIKVFGQPRQGELMPRVDMLSQRLLTQPSTSATQGYPGTGNPYNPYQNNPYQSNPYQANNYPTAPPLQTYTPPPGVGNPLPSQSGNGQIDPDYEAYGQVPAGGIQAPQNGGGNQPGNYDPNFLNALNQTEKRVLKTNYPNDPPQVRLGRMENKLFHTQAPPSVSEEDRLQRIIAVQAGGGGTSNPMTDRGSTFRTILPILLMIVPLLL
jgi:hypothetical protein